MSRNSSQSSTSVCRSIAILRNTVMMLLMAISESQPLSRCTASGRSPSCLTFQATKVLSTPPLTPMMQS